MINFHLTNDEQADPLCLYKSTHVATVIIKYIFKYGDCMLCCIEAGLL